MTHFPGESEQRYDHVRIVNIGDGTTLEGHDAVKDYFEQEDKLCRDHGPTLNFQVYRMNLQAHNIKELQGERLAEIKVDGKFVSGADTVVAVKDKIHRMLREKIEQNTQETRDVLSLGDGDHLTFYFNYRAMKDDALFYADNFIMLPAWIQVLIHRCDAGELIELISKLSKE